MSFIKQLLKAKNPTQTVFTVGDLTTIVSSYSGAKLQSALKYAVKQHEIIRISRGIYTLSNSYSKQEFANKYRTPSYISLYTVLQETGIVFQPYSCVYLVANRSEEIEIDGQQYKYRKIKDEMLLNSLGINTVNGVYKATPERALCDSVYLDGSQYFDNIRHIDWRLVKHLHATVYDNNPIIAAFITNNAL